MDRPNCHLCLVAAQALPNLLPALSPTSAPGQVILAGAAPLAHVARRLAACLQRRGIDCTRWEIIDRGDPAAIQAQLAERLAALPGAQRARIALNASGGSRAMAIAATALFRAQDLPIFCLTPTSEQLVWLHPATRAPQPLDADPTLAEVLAVQGLIAGGQESVAVAPPRQQLCAQQLCAWLAGENRRLEPALAALDALATSAATTTAGPAAPADGAQRTLDALIQRLALAGLVRLDRGRVRYSNRAARAFVQGGWLTEHCQTLLQGLPQPSPAVTALTRVTTLAREDGPEHPADLLCLTGTRLQVVVCLRPRQDQNRPRQDRKQPRQDQPGRDRSRATSGIDLDGLAQILTSSSARVLLLALVEPPLALRRQAARLGIVVCAGTRLSSLSATLQAWLGDTDPADAD